MNRMEELEGMVADGSMALRGKKEQAVLGKELTKLQTNLGGARDMKSLPAALFVIDTKREENAIKEARRLHIPGRRPHRHQLRSRRDRLRHPLQRRRYLAVSLMCELFADACLAGSGKEQISEAEMAGTEAPAAEAEAATEAAAE